MGETGLLTVLSTGMATLEEIEKAFRLTIVLVIESYIALHLFYQLTLMRSIFHIKFLSKKFNVHVGLVSF